MNATQRLGAFLARTRDAKLTREQASSAKIRLLDALGLAVLAEDEPTASAARAVATCVAEGSGTARLWADGKCTVLSEAVVANGIAVHAFFQDDTDHDSWTHPGSLVPPVAVSLGDALDAPLDAVLRAMVAGYATMTWLGAGEIVSRGLIGRGVRTSPTFGTIGAAAAAAVALGLDTGQAASAIGIAASTTGGTLEPVRCGSDEWRVQNGRAAQGGLLAAQLAGRGVLGAPDGLEGPKGLLRALAGIEEAPARWREDPDLDAIQGIMAKPFATLGDNMSAVMAARLLHGEGIELARVRRVTVAIWRPYTEYPGTSFKGPFERTVQTQASTAFATAAMLVHGRLDYQMGVERRGDPEILALVEKTTIVPDNAGGHLDATVELELDDGSIRRRTAAESPRNLIFQDEARATEVFEERLARAGPPQGTGRRLAADVLLSTTQGRDLPIRTLIDRLAGSNRGP